MLNDHARGYMHSCCYTKELWMALLHVSLSPAQACGGEDILYIFLIFPGHLEFWTPLQIPIWGPPLGCTLLHFYLCLHLVQDFIFLLLLVIISHQLKHD